MATPPTFVAAYEPASNWANTTTPKTASTTVVAGDLLVCVGGTADAATTLATPTGGTSLTWTLRQSHVLASHSGLWAWTAPVVTSETFSASIVRAGNTSNFWGFEIFRFSNHGGLGTTTKGSNSAGGAPLLNITTTGDNSAIVYVSGDWNAVDGTVRTYRTLPGTLTETSYFRDASQWGLYAGYYADAGATGVKGTGISAPTGQEDTIIAVEVLGTTAGTSSWLPGRKRSRLGALLQM